jgi:pimeloyl-ACP methyl ester carboxylesterase
MFKALTGALAALVFAWPALAQVPPFPVGFRTQTIETNGAAIHVRVGGSGPAVVLLHGYAETGDMWAPLAEDLARDRTVVVPDLRGLGLSSKPGSGFDKKTQAGDVAGVLDALKIDRAELVAHDIGNMVGFAFAMLYPERVMRLVLIDAPVPGIGPWEEILKNPLLWHFRFGGPDMERLVAGRERIYLDRFWNEFSANPDRFTETARALRAAVRAARRHALRLRAVRGLRPGRAGQPGAARRPGQARHAGVGGRRRKVVRRDDGDHHALRRQQRDRSGGSGLRPLDHGGEPQGDDRSRAQLPHRAVSAGFVTRT